MSEGGAEIEIGPQDYPKTADVSLMLEPGNKTISNEVYVSSFKAGNSTCLVQPKLLDLAQKTPLTIHNKEKLNVEFVRPKKIQRKEIKSKLSPLKSKISPKLKSPSPELVS